MMKYNEYNEFIYKITDSTGARHFVFQIRNLVLKSRSKETVKISQLFYVEYF